MLIVLFNNLSIYDLPMDLWLGCGAMVKRRAGAYSGATAILRACVEYDEPSLVDRLTRYR